ncbi:hypothetical protein Poli38472_009376 [Pythium oligandrum]|uniref:Uncharacterized protein n=1 Tax=Pythium oligandrum TaxID=41045 RepID=A0A8K1CLE5_PYTOL|nr:hypothetical protein Poli38472_009376 [Pythium oligandrum]|eukprot:TMW65209.1 hypothetical protein Poli38472_009376 [Pythium oligandrum]
MRSNDSLKVIVVGISKTVDDAGLSELFSAYGGVADAKVVRDAATNASRGFGFVTFTAQSAMKRAVREMDKKQVDGRTLNVRELEAKDKFQAKKAADKTPDEAGKRPCWLLRKGKCTKGAACPFSHDTKGGEFGSCFEFVQNGSCKRGDNCKFHHPTQEESEEADAVAKTEEKPGKKDKPADKKTVAPKEEKKETEPKQRVCFAFQKGRCHRGKKCLYVHEKLDVPAEPAPVAAPVKTKPSDFEVVKQPETSRKRRRDSVGSEDSESEEEVKKVEAKAPKKTKTVVKSEPEVNKASTKSESATSKSKSEPEVKKASTKSESVTTKPPTKSEPATEPEKDTAPVEAAAAPTENGEEAPKYVHFTEKPICRHFAKGRCKRGKICFFLHQRPAKAPKEESEEEHDDPAPLQALADHVAAFMANLPNGGGAPPVRAIEPVVVEEEVKSESPVKADKPVKRAIAAVEDTDDAPVRPVKKFKKEKVDMGAAFDGASDDDDNHNGRGRRRVVDKEQMRANRAKLVAERRTKRQAKKEALSRLKSTDGEIELA